MFPSDKTTPSQHLDIKGFVEANNITILCTLGLMVAILLF